jgi:2-polyprenyl-3-methyl-5-hydroxy-6-metoxy-1,4-benzoquinol methylase
LAYGQFVRKFLLPLLAEQFLHWPLQSTQFARDGYEPRTIYEALRPWQRLSPGLLDVVTLATLLEGGKGKSNGPVRCNSASTTDPELAAHILHKRFARLSKQIAHSSSDEKRSAWSNYQQSATHYSPADIDAKQGFVRAMLEQCRPARVLDIGANTGTYSVIAAESGASVVALDSDVAAISALFRSAAQSGLKITPLVANIARPTPAMGWRNREQLSLLERLNGNFDMVLMLAVIHHLILREQIPLTHIADLCAGLTRRWLVLEWVPPTDPMFQEWLRGRDDLYGHLSEEDLQRAFAPYFAQATRIALKNARVLLLFERNTVDGPALSTRPA